MEENKEKKKDSYLGFFIAILIVAALAYVYVKTDVYTKIPHADRSGSKYVGTWYTVGMGDHKLGEKFDSFEPINAHIQSKEVNQHTMENQDEWYDFGGITMGNGYLMLPMKYTLYENGRSMCECLGNKYKGTWEETENGVHYKPFIVESSFNPSLNFYEVESLNGKTPGDYGYDCDAFLIQLSSFDEMSPEELEALKDTWESDSDEPLSEDTRSGFTIYARY